MAGDDRFVRRGPSPRPDHDGAEPGWVDRLAPLRPGARPARIRPLDPSLREAPVDEGRAPGRRIPLRLALFQVRAGGEIFEDSRMLPGPLLGNAGRELPKR